MAAWIREKKRWKEKKKREKTGRCYIHLNLILFCSVKIFAKYTPICVCFCVFSICQRSKLVKLGISLPKTDLLL